MVHYLADHKLKDKNVQQGHAALQSAHQEVADQKAFTGVKGNIVYDREIRLFNPETRRFERFVVPKDVEKPTK